MRASISRVKPALAFICEYGGILVMLAVGLRVFILALCLARTSTYEAHENALSLAAGQRFLAPFGGYLFGFVVLFVIGLALWRYGLRTRTSRVTSHCGSSGENHQGGSVSVYGMLVLAVAVLFTFCLATTSTSTGELETVSEEISAQADDAHSLASDNEARVDELEWRIDDLESRTEEVEGAVSW